MQTGYRRVVSVVVYDTVEELQVAAARYRREEPGFFAQAQAVTQPRVHLSIAADGSERRYDGCGVVRLVKGQGAGILAHEMTHMALAIYRDDMGRASLRNMKNEETLCHIVSDLVIAANRKLWELGVYSNG
ncbi:MAG: hypothetical protein AB7I04_18520 [Pseudomonadales bacterium]